MSYNIKDISLDLIEKFKCEFEIDKTAKVVQNAVTGHSINDICTNRDVIQNTDHSFSIKLDEWSVTNQKSSGRCWLFAILNLFRVGAAKKMNLKEFEFSQSHLHFWDKFERCNHFLEAIIETSNRDIDDRTVHFLLGDPIGDGGQYSMAVNLIKKHGLAPKAAFPESISSSATLQMNTQLKDILRSSACELRAIMNDTIDASNNEMNARKHKEYRMNNIWRILCIHLGTPPRSFDWQWTDKDKVFHKKGKMTPNEFCKEYVEIDWENYVCVVHDPRNKSMQTYSVDYLQSVAGGEPVKYLNIDCEAMKLLTLKNIQAGLPVWMGCDVGKQFHRVKGIWDEKMFEYSNLYGVDYGMNKVNRLLHGQSFMSHAMMFTGCDVGEDGNPIRWRVENSWGDVNGIKGFYTMNDNWFNEYMFEIATPKCFLTDEMLTALDTVPFILPAWDCMGSLARSEAKFE